MSGIGIASCAGGGGAAPPAGFTATFIVFSTPGKPTGTLDVRNASGTSDGSDPAGNGERRFTLSASNGTPPYTFTTTVTSNPSGKLGITNSGGNFNYVTWSGFTLNETETITVHCTARDSAGHSGSGDLSITIHRLNSF